MMIGYSILLLLIFTSYHIAKYMLYSDVLWLTILGTTFKSADVVTTPQGTVEVITEDMTGPFFKAGSNVGIVRA